MSIWDYFNGSASPEQNAGLTGFAAALNGALGDGRRPVGFGQILSAGAQGMQQGRDQYAEQEQARQALALQAKLMGFKLKEAESDFDNQEAQRARAKKLIEFNQKYFGGGMGAAGQAPAGMEGMSQAAAPQMQPPMMGGPASLPQLGAQPGAAPAGGMQQKSGVFDQRMAYAQALRADGFAEQADAQEAQALKFQPKVSGWKEVKQNGKVLYAPFFEDGTNGNPVPLEVAKQLEKVNAGGTTELVDSFTGATVRSLNNTMSPEATASNALGWANNRVAQGQLGIAGQRLGLARQEAETKAAAGKAPTEFQGKSAAFGARAAEADKTITGLQGKYEPARVNAKMSAQDFPLVGGITGAVANNFLSDSEQLAEQAQRDFINAILRQESGAAIGKDEFTNARRQYFPQPGDSDAVIQQKARNRALSVQGLNNNAGRAAFSAPAAPAGGGWSIKKVGQ